MYNKSLDLMDEHLQSLTDEEFLDMYSQVGDNVGPTVKQFLEEGCMTNVQKLQHRVDTMQAEGLARFVVDVLGEKYDDQEEAAEAILNMLDSPIVPDKELF